MSKVPFLVSWTDLFSNGAPDLLSTHLGLLRFDLSKYLQEREIPSVMWMDMIFCREMMEKEEIGWHLIRSSYSTINWNNSPDFVHLLSLMPSFYSHSFVGSMMRNVLIAYTEASWVWLSGKRKLLGGVVTGKTASSSVQTPTSTNSFPSLSVSPPLGLIPFLFQIVWELQFTSCHYPEHSPPLPKPRSSDANKSLTSVFIKVFNLIFAVAS